MKFLLQWLRFSSFPSLNSQVWILVWGRLLSEIGSGFTRFYAPIFFVNQVGLSATEVGLALGSASISGVFGRIFSGTLANSPRWGRRRTLMLSLAILALACLSMLAANNLIVLVAANLLEGLGIGLYWPASESVVADLTQGEQRREAYALNRLADNLGLGLGIVLGGILINFTGAYRLLFAIDAISFAVFLGVVYWAIKETYQFSPMQAQKEASSGWAIALGDRRLVVYVLVNVIFTTYISQIHSTTPLYFSNFVSAAPATKGLPPATISALFAWHLILAIALQLPIARFLAGCSHSRALVFSALLWAMGFICMALAGAAAGNQLAWAIVALGIWAIANAAYAPAASSLVADLAPESARSIYISINSLCWAVGYFIGPPLGGWALDRPAAAVPFYWLALALSTAATIGILQYLQRIISDVRC